MTIRKWLDDAVQRLGEVGNPEALLQAQWMLADAMGVSRTHLRLMGGEEIENGALSRADSWLEDRLTGKPLQYVEGCAWFMGYRFCVDERVLIPRQDTEVLCERAIAITAGTDQRVLDLCTGSGAVGISLKLACPGAEVYLSDLSEGALAVARENAARLGARVHFLQGDFLEPAGDMKFNLIAVNPPYLTLEDMAQLQREVTYEPRMALYGGVDGLDFYRRAAEQAPGHLTPGGTLLMEVGAGQAGAVSRLLGGAKCHRDLAGILRVVEKRY